MKAVVILLFLFSLCILGIMKRSLKGESMTTAKWIWLLMLALFCVTWGSIAAVAAPVAEDKILRSIKITGSTAFQPADLESQLKVVRLNSSVTREMVEYDIEMNLRGYLNEHGFILSEVHWDLMPPDGRDVELRISIAEGPQFRLVSLILKGFAAFSSKTVYSQFNMKDGDVLNYSELKNGINRIRSMYADRGFIKWEFIPEIYLDKQKQTAAITYEFVEGKQYRVDHIKFVGCRDKAEEDRLRAQVDIQPGDIYSAGKKEATFAQLKRFGVIKDSVHIVDEERGLIGITFWLRDSQE